jgi:hypothetical protein
VLAGGDGVGRGGLGRLREPERGELGDERVEIGGLELLALGRASAVQAVESALRLAARVEPSAKRSSSAATSAGFTSRSWLRAQFLGTASSQASSSAR